ncbi:MAG: rhomboid family intramembrane serine protease [Actinomycetota bacterium]
MPLPEMPEADRTRPLTGPPPTGAPMQPPTGASLPQPPGPAPQRPPTGAPGGAGAAPDTCYRHADREAGRRCTRCGRPACGDCLVSASVGSHCRDCAKASQPDLRTRAKFWQARQSAIVTMTLIAINVAVFLAMALFGDAADLLSGRATDGHYLYGLNQVFLDGVDRLVVVPDANGEFFTIDSSGQQWYRLITAGFIHFGILHLALNSYFIYLLGGELERGLGRAKYLALYLTGILGGSAGSLLIDGIDAERLVDGGAVVVGISGGASGAAFALMGAYAIGIWRHGVNVFQTQIGSLLLINLFITFAIPRISIGGHLGGLVAGGICGFVMMAPAWKGVPAWAKWATPAAVAVAAIAISLVAAG